MTLRAVEYIPQSPTCLRLPLFFQSAVCCCFFFSVPAMQAPFFSVHNCLTVVPSSSLSWSLASNCFQVSCFPFLFCFIVSLFYVFLSMYQSFDAVGSCLLVLLSCRLTFFLLCFLLCSFVCFLRCMYVRLCLFIGLFSLFLLVSVKVP